MKCPYCKQDNTTVNRVVNSDTPIVRVKRRRLCLSCGNYFNTVEEVSIKDIGNGDKKMQYKYAEMITDKDSKFCKGVKFEVLGYSKTCNQYYVRPLEGTVTHWVDADNLKLIGE